MAAQKRSVQYVGWFPLAAHSSVGTQGLNAAATFMAFGFVPDATRTVSKVKVCLSAITGSLAAGDLRCDVYSDNAKPNTSLSFVATLTAPAAVGWIEFTGFSQSVTENTQYWVVIRNLNATPASNFPTIKVGAPNSSGLFPTMGGNATSGWARNTSADSGATWAGTSASNVYGIRIEYADGTFDGLPIELASNPPSLGTSGGVFSTREAGVKLTVPNNTAWNVRGIAMAPTKTGTPTNDPYYRLYLGSTLLGTTPTIPRAQVSLAFLCAYFAAPIVVYGGQVIRVVMGEGTNSDTSANCFFVREWTFENDANSKALKPFEGTLQKTYFDGTSWVDTDTMISAVALLLDTDGPFAGVGNPLQSPLIRAA